ncbi:porin family protein [Microbulbifer variabilis]|uniref:Porin family protein n=1 Tax=Microbulbifer variabilis TaxID=266805 RepID=A0ABY4VA82_9GAMM|nr:outer membrane beta-barrel protein [Microbulbifer variabilis]USD21072.1 porin family protein [Microbulbifer variabilis]
MKRFILATAIALSASNTIALENNFYLKSTYGSVDTNISSKDALESFKTKLSDSSGWSITLGYRLNKFIALEGGFADLGDTEGSYRHEEWSFSQWGDEMSEISTIDYKISTDTKILGLFLTTDITKDFYAGARVGYQLWDEQFQKRHEFSARWDWGDYHGINTTDETNDGSDPYYGISVGWNNNNWSLSLEHTIFEMKDRKPSLSSLGLTYNF